MQKREREGFFLKRSVRRHGPSVSADTCQWTDFNVSVALVETQFAYDGFEVIGFHFLKAPSFDIDRGERFVA